MSTGRDTGRIKMWKGTESWLLKWVSTASAESGVWRCGSWWSGAATAIKSAVSTCGTRTWTTWSTR